MGNCKPRMPFRVPGLDLIDLQVFLGLEFARASLPERGRDAQTERSDPHGFTAAKRHRTSACSRAGIARDAYLVRFIDRRYGDDIQRAC
jgi:hypothetical protein